MGNYSPSDVKKGVFSKALTSSTIEIGLTHSIRSISYDNKKLPSWQSSIKRSDLL